MTPKSVTSVGKRGQRLREREREGEGGDMSIKVSKTSLDSRSGRQMYLDVRGCSSQTKQSSSMPTLPHPTLGVIINYN